MAGAKCGNPACGHAAHTGKCRAKARSSCVPFGGPGQISGFMCGWRPPCPCSRRVCKCGAAVAMTTLIGQDGKPAEIEPGIGIEVPVVPRSAADPAGRLEVWQTPDGQWWSRELGEGERPGEGRWRAVEHTGACQPF